MGAQRLEIMLFSVILFYSLLQMGAALAAAFNHTDVSVPADVDLVHLGRAFDTSHGMTAASDGIAQLFALLVEHKDA